MIYINNISISVHSREDKLIAKISRELAIKQDDIKSFKIVKRSIDARKKDDVRYIYAVDVDVKDELGVLKRQAKNINVSKSVDNTYKIAEHGLQELRTRPVVIGFGPAGIYASLLLAREGYRPIVIERGEDVESRTKSVDRFWNEAVLDEESNVSFGEGGAGAFSDGKLNTMVKDKLGRNNEVLRILVEFGAPSDILIEQKPHIGTDLLKDVIKNIREEIKRLGGEIRFSTKLVDINLSEDRRVESIELSDGSKLDCEVLILAIGHSSRDTFKLLYDKGFKIEPKPFAIGLRVQHPQSMIDSSQYGDKSKDILPVASYKLTAKTSAARGVYSFCMCPGGYVVNASTEKNRLAINGMSYHDRDSDSANSAIIVTVDSSDFKDNNTLSGVEFQRNLEELCYNAGGGKIPVQLLGDFLAGRETKTLGETKACFKGDYTFARLDLILPEFIVDALREAFVSFDKKIKGFMRDDAILSAIESRTSSPIRILRDENLEASLQGIYPCGEGAGYAGGISSAAIDGLKVAESIIYRYSNKHL